MCNTKKSLPLLKLVYPLVAQYAKTEGLMFAANVGDLDVVQFLMEKGASLTPDYKKDKRWNGIKHNKEMMGILFPTPQKADPKKEKKVCEKTPKKSGPRFLARKIASSASLDKTTGNKGASVRTPPSSSKPTKKTVNTEKSQGDKVGSSVSSSPTSSKSPMDKKPKSIKTTAPKKSPVNDAPVQTAPSSTSAKAKIIPSKKAPKKKGVFRPLFKPKKTPILPKELAARTRAFEHKSQMPKILIYNILALHIMNVIENAGFVCRWMGGTVRDRSLGIKPYDYDYRTNADKGTLLYCLFQKTPKLQPHTTPIEGMLAIDINTPRGNFHADIHYGKNMSEEAISKDGITKDLTVNALCLSSSGKLIGRGEYKLDLALRILRACRENFLDDVSRVIRFLRLLSTGFFTFEESLRQAVSIYQLNFAELQVWQIKKIAREVKRIESTQNSRHHIYVYGLWQCYTQFLWVANRYLAQMQFQASLMQRQRTAYPSGSQVLFRDSKLRVDAIKKPVLRQFSPVPTPMLKG